MTSGHVNRSYDRSSKARGEALAKGYRMEAASSPALTLEGKTST